MLAEAKTMKVYRNGSKEKSLKLHVTPGNDIEGQEWFDPEGKPLLVTVEFKDGVAVVAEQLGQYLLDKGLADKNRRILEVA